MFDLFAGEQFDQPDLDTLALDLRDRDLHLMSRDGVVTLIAGEHAGDRAFLAREVLRLANIGAAFLRMSAVRPYSQATTIRNEARREDARLVARMEPPF